jgi:hypothetical protein
MTLTPITSSLSDKIATHLQRYDTRALLESNAIVAISVKVAFVSNGVITRAQKTISESWKKFALADLLISQSPPDVAKDAVFQYLFPAVAEGLPSPAFEELEEPSESTSAFSDEPNDELTLTRTRIQTLKEELSPIQPDEPPDQRPTTFSKMSLITQACLQGYNRPDSFPKCARLFDEVVAHECRKAQLVANRPSFVCHRIQQALDCCTKALDPSASYQSGTLAVTIQSVPLQAIDPHTGSCSQSKEVAFTLEYTAEE